MNTHQWEPERETVDLTLEVIAQDTRRDDLVGLSMFLLACVMAAGLMLWWSR